MDALFYPIGPISVSPCSTFSDDILAKVLEPHLRGWWDHRCLGVTLHTLWKWIGDWTRAIGGEGGDSMAHLTTSNFPSKGGERLSRISHPLIGASQYEMCMRFIWKFWQYLAKLLFCVVSEVGCELVSLLSSGFVNIMPQEVRQHWQFPIRIRLLEFYQCYQQTDNQNWVIGSSSLPLVCGASS